MTALETQRRNAGGEADPRVPTAIFRGVWWVARKRASVTETGSDPGSTSSPANGDSPDEGRWKRYEANIRAQLAAATEAAESRRGKSRLVDSGYLIFERNRILPATLMVGALASRIVIYLIPLLALVIFSFGLYSDVTDESASEAVRGAGMAVLFAEAAEDSTELDDGLRLAATIATAFAVLWGANSLGRLTRRISALVWGVPYTKAGRPWLVPLAVIALTIVSWLITALAGAADEGGFQVFVGALVAELMILSAFWLLVSRLLPHDPETKLGQLMPGAIFVALGVVGMRVAMIIYFAPAVDQLSGRYGSIALALVMLTWAYWLGMIMVGSVEINAALFRTRSRPPRP